MSTNLKHFDYHNHNINFAKAKNGKYYVSNSNVSKAIGYKESIQYPCMPHVKLTFAHSKNINLDKLFDETSHRPINIFSIDDLIKVLNHLSKNSDNKHIKLARDFKSYLLHHIIPKLSKNTQNNTKVFSSKDVDNIKHIRFYDDYFDDNYITKLQINHHNYYVLRDIVQALKYTSTALNVLYKNPPKVKVGVYEDNHKHRVNIAPTKDVLIMLKYNSKHTETLGRVDLDKKLAKLIKTQSNNSKTKPLFKKHPVPSDWHPVKVQTKSKPKHTNPKRKFHGKLFHHFSNPYDAKVTLVPKPSILNLSLAQAVKSFKSKGCKYIHSLPMTTDNLAKYLVFSGVIKPFTHRPTTLAKNLHLVSLKYVKGSFFGFQMMRNELLLTPKLQRILLNDFYTK